MYLLLAHKVFVLDVTEWFNSSAFQFETLNEEIFHRFYDKPSTFKSTITKLVMQFEKVRNKALSGTVWR
jgi:hypothetical protein